jgi:predicted nucleic acid-binding protein
VILLDTSGLLAALDESQQFHGPAVACLTAARPPMVLSPFVLADLDHLLATRQSRRSNAEHSRNAAV